MSVSAVLARAAAAATRDVELQLANEEKREIELTTSERWARDPEGWIDEFVWIASRLAADGKELVGRKLRAVKMRQFPDQRATLNAWIDVPHLKATGELVFRNVIIDKSRQIGETWEFAAIMCWAMHYHSVAGLAMHLKGGKIDDGGERNTVESLFGRVRYIDRRLDRGRVPGLGGQLVFRPFSRDPAKIENPSNGAVWIGEGQTDNPGRGSSFDAMLGDEFAFVEHSDKVYAAIDEACPQGKALLSTPYGEGNEHARIADERPDGWVYLRLHWSGHPVYSKGVHVAGEDPDCQLCEGNRLGIEWSPRNAKAHRFPGKLTSPWYDQRVVGKTLEQVANELDIDREGALSSRVYREFSTSVHVVETGIPYDEFVQLELAADYGLDTTAVIFIQDSIEEVRVIGIVEMGDQHGTTATPDTVARELRRYAVEVLGVRPDLVTPEWTAKWPAIGDPSAHNRDMLSARPWMLAYRRLGFVFGRPPSRLTRSVDPSINSVKRLLLGTPKPIRICGVKADALAKHLRNNTWPADSSGRRRLGATRPLDDEHNHSCRAIGYWAVDRYPPIDKDTQERQGPTVTEKATIERLQHRRRLKDDSSPLGYGSRL